ncbi:hypothetical protein C5167_050605 [Papaver somniferum]|uniref:Uncharacterized protein n=1 Tax=Papaver somniferum TaxID=3469 RepID=A0A4Y7KQM2_PAPSO|nr:hypothetical protein C5167_050605 [Papaver somniferum]
MKIEVQIQWETETRVAVVIEMNFKGIGKMGLMDFGEEELFAVKALVVAEWRKLKLSDELLLPVTVRSKFESDAMGCCRGQEIGAAELALQIKTFLREDPLPFSAGQLEGMASLINMHIKVARRRRNNNLKVGMQASAVVYIGKQIGDEIEVRLLRNLNYSLTALAALKCGALL